MQWKSFKVTYSYDPEYKQGPKLLDRWSKTKIEYFKSKTITVKIPADMKKGEVIKGVIRENRAFAAFAHKNRFAMYNKEGDYPYGGPHKTMLKELAEVSGHPEVEHAGAVLYGTSNKGRFAAHFAHFWPERTLAVILDHSWTSGVPLKSVKVFSSGQLPMAKGVPYFFNASQKNAQAGYNRRELHYKWCIKGYKSGQPCTSIISYEDVGHGDPGDRTLQGVWLEDVIKIRVPEKISTDGKAYKLLPVDPRKSGAYMSVKIKTAGKVSYYTDIKVGPRVSRTSWWIPGSASAALAVEWLKKNNGKILQDDSAKIK